MYLLARKQMKSSDFLLSRMPIENNKKKVNDRLALELVGKPFYFLLE